MVKLCFEFALELDEVTTEKQMIRTGGCGQGCVGECDLPDQYSDQPELVQGLQVKKEFPEFKKVASAKGLPQKLIVTEATKQIRPFAVTADWDARLGHAEGTILHDAKAPKDIKFVLLNQLKAYFPIIRDSPVYPVVYDANGVVLSLPPIINGDHSKISTTLETILTAKANVYIGIDESAEALAKMLNRLFPTTQNASKQLEVLIPPTRHDMLHVCDIEDVGACDYNRIPKTLPATMHIARQCPLNKLTKQLHIEKIPAVQIANPKTLEYQVVRTSLIPGLLKTLAANRKIPLPLNLFEVSDVVLADSKAEVGAKNERRVCAVKLLDCVSLINHPTSLVLAAQVHSSNPPPGAQLVSDLPAQFNCPQKYATLKSSDRSSSRKTIPNGDKITRPVCCRSKPRIRSVPYHREFVPLPPQYFLRIVSDRCSISSCCRQVPCASHASKSCTRTGFRRPSPCYSRIRVVHLVSRNALAEQIFMDWHQKFGQNSGCKVVKLTEETGTNIRHIA
ncbi:phenylalanyl-tRNA synthetase beta chain [Culex quinquefasciatus]|uniref:phenylalanine--tRNA ligase n=1 Tax=Culex quinquefasciatus TaxID=7176 RepID=B0X9D4_CULQU|nr:phenylalanyl-tRNA synthetase beta chain [Culex quinquefasciatus]|eukprot:XP_001866256.1 phenylalanyl-tRNA synthetase beta chain [Culex quinquefasciatus]